ncbi:hypothetical protein TNIN_319471 [Trichonephila inaurata madagascariensis]|uniref:Uncharacterized protein n=1 Tax=Trichonephila inaurata madagascariensis TaxID=2747483 RepID=A0A8X6WS73_9ARAC|nr:hypothetical protein TNIN_319471 [Trichonephila inaurata madagascariensis]
MRIRGLFIPSKLSWSLKKENWSLFTKFLEHGLSDDKLDFILNLNKEYKTIKNAMISYAKRFIPIGRQKKYRSFWSDELTSLKAKRDRLKRKAVVTSHPCDVQLKIKKKLSSDSFLENAFPQHFCGANSKNTYAEIHTSAVKQKKRKTTLLQSEFESSSESVSEVPITRDELNYALRSFPCGESHKWLLILSDGSLLSDSPNADARVLSKSFPFYAPVGRGTAFDDEIDEIRTTLS